MDAVKVTPVGKLKLAPERKVGFLVIYFIKKITCVCIFHKKLKN